MPALHVVDFVLISGLKLQKIKGNCIIIYIILILRKMPVVLRQEYGSCFAHVILIYCV